jgi:Fe-S cluster assembly scaffold protein SufB
MMTDTTREIEELQNELWMKKTPQERARFAAAMFAAGKNAVIASLPKNISEKDLKKQLYFRIYGENLPEDFFRT